MNATLPRLHSDPRSPAMAPPLPDMPVVRCAADSPHTGPAAASIRGDGQVPQGAGRLDGHGPRRNGAAKVGEDADTAAAPWWGCHFGLRQPEAGETALSAEEVRHAVSIGVAVDPDDEHDAWPIKQSVRPWGTWRFRAKRKEPAHPFSGLLP